MGRRSNLRGDSGTQVALKRDHIFTVIFWTDAKRREECGVM